MKTFGIAAVAVIAALILGFGARLSSATPAHADTTAVAVVPCEVIADATDGSTTDGATSVGEYVTACGTAATPPAITPAVITNLANTLGNADGTLTASDLTAAAAFGGNQIGAGCTIAQANLVGCTQLVFVFVDNASTVKFDAPTGLQFSPADASSNDWTCDTVAEDADCAGTGGDGVVVAGLLNGTDVAGATGTIHVTQDTVPQDATITIVGTAHNVDLTLAETTLQAAASATAHNTCATDSDVTDPASLSAPTSTIAIAVVTDAAGTTLTRVPVTLKSGTTGVADFATVAQMATAKTNGVLTSSGETVDAGTNGIAQFAVLCAGATTGTSTITATINATLTNEDISTADVTVVGPASALALTASPAQIACDGSQTSTVTAKVTDSAGNNVADGTTVNFSVVALGTANPINVKTVAGSASSTITPLSVSNAGVTVTVTSGDAQASIRVDCSLAVPPTAVPPPPVAPTPIGGTGTITGPNTGTGGYLNQDGSSSFPMWTLVALALGSVVLVAGGVVTRRAGK